MNPGLYDLIRITDQTGVSGTGRVAQVAVFEDGTATTRWLTGKDSFANWAKVEDMVDVHIRCHPDTTRLVPAGSEVCDHGMVVDGEYCESCTQELTADERRKRMKDSQRWAALRQESKKMAKALYDYCESRQLRGEEHNAHGLYFDVWVDGKRYMLDASPEDIPHGKRVPGLVIVRDDSHHYEKPTRVGLVNLFEKNGALMLDHILGVTVAK